MSLRVYIAAPWELQAEAKQLAGFLREVGVETTSRWLYAASNTYSDEWAKRCLHDITVADALIAFNPEEYARKGTGGRHWEAAHANALAKLVIVVGARTNIFHVMRHIEHVPIDGHLITNILAIATKHRLLAERPKTKGIAE